MARNIRRVVSGIDTQGRSVWSTDDSTACARDFPNGARVTDLWAAPRTPLDVRDYQAPQTYSGWPPIGGLTFRVAEVPPHKRAPGGTGREGMHSSDTVDFTVIISGEIWCYQQNEPEGKLLKPGDTLVQR